MVACYVANVNEGVRFPYPAPLLIVMMLSGCTTIHPTEKFDAFVACEEVWESRPLVENGNRTPDGFYTENDHKHYHCRVDKMIGFSYKL